MYTCFCLTDINRTFIGLVFAMLKIPSREYVSNGKSRSVVSAITGFIIDLVHRVFKKLTPSLKKLWAIVAENTHTHQARIIKYLTDT